MFTLLYNLIYVTLGSLLEMEVHTLATLNDVKLNFQSAFGS